jgi:hypothetical protein
MLGFDHLQTDCARNVIGALTPPTSGLPRTAYYLVGHIQVTCITQYPIHVVILGAESNQLELPAGDARQLRALTPKGLGVSRAKAGTCNDS